MSMRTPLARVRGLGSAKDGVSHWWVQRLTAVALIPLVIWFVFSMLCMVGASYGEAVAWISRPLNTTLSVLLIAIMLHHAQLGVQVVIEDYFHVEWIKVTGIVLMKMLAVLLAVAGIIAVLRVAFGSH
jgi:succinate dehydrogenase / fumarate reductase, membrane anchor subunit